MVRTITALAPIRDELGDEFRILEGAARRFGAEVEFVLAQRDVVNLPGHLYEGAAAYGENLVAKVVDAQEQEARNAAGRVEAWAGAANVRARLEQVVGAAEEVLTERMRTSDLTVLPRPNERNDVDIVAAILAAGRPALVAAGHRAAFGETVAVFWKSTPEAARAAAAAVNLLASGAKVRVFSVEEGESAKGDGLERVGSWFRSHGFDADVARIRPIEGGNIPDSLMAAAGEMDADLVVMGAYGHSRLREWALGGASRHIFSLAERPILVSH